MKKLCRGLALALVLVLGSAALCGCGENPVEAVLAERTPAPPRTPAPTATPEPTVEPTPEPTPDPARFIGIADSTLIRVVKQPGGERVSAGGATMFTALAEGAVSRQWRFVAPDKGRELVWDDPAVASSFPGLKAGGGDTATLELYGIPSQLDGWYAVCLFTDETGAMLVSDGALIQVTG